MDKLGRRGFLKRLGATSVFAPFAVVGKDFFTEAKNKITILFKRRSIEVPDYSNIPTRTGIPLLDLLVYLDYPKQHLQCTCAFTLDGSVAHYCEEGKRLEREKYKAGVELQSHFPEIDEYGRCEIRTAFREYLKAEWALRKHYWSS